MELTGPVGKISKQRSPIHYHLQKELWPFTWQNRRTTALSRSMPFSIDLMCRTCLHTYYQKMCLLRRECCCFLSPSNSNQVQPPCELPPGFTARISKPIDREIATNDREISTNDRDFAAFDRDFTKHKNMLSCIYLMYI